MCNIHTCPVKPYTIDVTTDAKQLATSLRKLKRAMRHCDECDNQDGCPIISDFNAQFTAAISEIVEEWGLSVYQ